MSTKSSITRRDFLAFTSGTVAAATLGLPRALIAAPESAKQAPAGAKIASVAIYPAIGFSRVGNSDKFFYAPEVPGVPPEPEGGFKDGLDKFKKQVQRFRVYGLDREGRVVREITKEAGDSIDWTVHVANTKAAWYEFKGPLDMGAGNPGMSGQPRNQFIEGEDREKLVIDPGPQQISVGKKPVELIGDFWLEPHRVPVKLGELRTDESGRLLVFPGEGKGSSAIPNNPIKSFSDNDGWYDDWCDGPVNASVTLKDGVKLDAIGAWVVCCGPDFVPGIHAITTLYDVIRDAMVNGKRFAGKKALSPNLSSQISFLEEIYPIFQRLGQMEWLANNAQLQEGWIKVRSFLDSDHLNKLADPSAENKAFRQSIFELFRNPDSEKIDQYKLPYMLGSGADYAHSPAHWFLLTKLQYDTLKKWSAGEFVNDLDRKESQIRTLDETPLEHQPDALTRAALDACSGGAFHPGVELTWPLRQEALFRDDTPFRIALSNRKSLLQNGQVGRLLTPASAFNRQDKLEGTPETKSGEAYTFVPGAEAPIGPQAPGDLTRWMGLPWFGDAFSCGLAIDYANDFPQAIWWPALTPIDILPEAYYRQLSSKDLSDEEKLAFFEKRVPWVRGVRGVGLHTSGSYVDGLIRASELWGRFGIIEARKRPDNLSDALKKVIPEVLFVEVGRGSLDPYSDQNPFLGH